jgi:hypothetical protein
MDGGLGWVRACPTCLTLAVGETALNRTMFRAVSLLVSPGGTTRLLAVIGQRGQETRLLPPVYSRGGPVPHGDGYHPVRANVVFWS